MNTRLMNTLRVLGLAALAVTGACTLTGQTSNIGLECDDSGDCDDSTLGCAPVDDQDPQGDRVCMPPPGEWTCAGEFFGDGACDCGCAILDVDCANELGSSCAADGDNCPSGQDPDPADNTKCL